MDGGPGTADGGGPVSGPLSGPAGRPEVDGPERRRPGPGRGLVARWWGPEGGARIVPGLALDGVVTAVMLVLAVLVVQAGIDLGPIPPATSIPGWAVNGPCLVAAIAPVAVRRRWPVAALVLSVAGVAAARLLSVPEFQITSVALFLCLYAAGRWGRVPIRDWARAGAVVVLLVVLAESVRRERALLTEAIVPDRAYYLLSVVGIVFNLVFLVLAWRLGDSSRRTAERTEELAERTVELEREREENARRAVLEERLRIARELHDVVAHHVSVMGIQAAAVRRVAGQQPERVGPGLEAIEEASRQAINELQRLLGFLRQGPEVGADAASEAGVTLPALGSLDVVRRQLADAGLAVAVRVEGQERPLPPAIDVSAFRILQESLTNVLKHSSADEARVVIAYGPESLRLEVVNADTGSRVTGRQVGGVGTGSGLLGMRERTALVGGRLEAGGRDGGGFTVVAVLPYHGRPSPAPGLTGPDPGSRPVAVGTAAGPVGAMVEPG